MRNKFVSFILVALLSLPLFAADVNLKAYVSKTTVGLNDHFEYSVEVSGKSNNLPDVKFPDLSKFFILSGPNQSTSIQFVNGAMSASKTMSYILQPRDKGTITIGKASIEVGGTSYESNTVTIEVTNAPPAQNNKQQNSPPVSQNEPDIAGQSLFLKSVVSKSSPYQGEQVVIEYKLYFKVNVRTYEMDKLPSYTGFWTEEFNTPNQPVIENEVVNGVNYNVATLRKVAVFPTQSGQLTIDPLSINVEAVVQSRRSRRSLFDSFFDPVGQSVRKNISSKPIKLNVKPLPQTDKPISFNGAVGSFRYNVKADKTTLKVNDAISLKLSLSGEGNFKLANIPEVNIPQDIERYDPKISSNVNRNSSTIQGTKTAEYVLIPRLPGEYVIKPGAFSYFDPNKKRYFTKTIDPITVNVTGQANPAIANQPMGGVGRQEVTLLGRDIRYIKEQTVFYEKGDRELLSFKYWSSAVLALVLFVGFLFYDDRQAKISGDKVLARNRHASRMANKFLAEARKKLQASNPAEFYKAVNAALTQFVQDKLNIDLSDFSASKAQESLKQKNIPDELIKDYIDLISEGDFRQFAGTQSDSGEREAFLDKARNVITKLEKFI